MEYEYTNKNTISTKRKKNQIRTPHKNIFLFMLKLNVILCSIMYNINSRMEIQEDREELYD